MTNTDFKTPYQEINELSSKAWEIHSILKTMYAALPDDAIDCDIEVKCLTSCLMRLSDDLASNLMDYSTTVLRLEKQPTVQAA